MYEISTTAYYRDRTSEIRTDVELDGLVPTWEQIYEYD